MVLRAVATITLPRMYKLLALWCKSFEHGIGADDDDSPRKIPTIGDEEALLARIKKKQEDRKAAPDAEEKIARENVEKKK